MTEYSGQFIAIQEEAVKADGATVDELIEALKTQAIDPRYCVVEYVPKSGQSLQMVRTF